jgi:hypothetical protein
MTDSNSDTDDGIDVKQFAGETVKIQTEIIGTNGVASVVDGEVSGTGKTISVETPTGKTRRLPTETIMSGEAHYPSSSTRSFELYQKERFQRSQEANWGPGPQRGANEVSDDDDLPEPTHSPVA